MIETTPSKYIITAAAIVFTICCICLLVPSATAETIAFTATYNYLFTQLETEDQARIIALARTRQAIFNAAETAIRKTQIYQNALPVENLSHALASAVMTFETSSMVLNKIPQGHSLSLKLIGRLVYGHPGNGSEPLYRKFVSL